MGSYHILHSKVTNGTLSSMGPLPYDPLPPPIPRPDGLSGYIFPCTLQDNPQVTVALKYGKLPYTTQQGNWWNPVFHEPSSPQFLSLHSLGGPPLVEFILQNSHGSADKWKVKYTLYWKYCNILCTCMLNKKCRVNYTIIWGTPLSLTFCWSYRWS